MGRCGVKKASQPAQENRKHKCLCVFCVGRPLVWVGTLLCGAPLSAGRSPVGRSPVGPFPSLCSRRSTWHLLA